MAFSVEKDWNHESRQILRCSPVMHAVSPIRRFVRARRAASDDFGEIADSFDHPTLWNVPKFRIYEAVGKDVSERLGEAGIAAFGDVREDVLTEGEFVPAGTPVRVTRVEGARIFVRPVEEV